MIKIGSIVQDDSGNVKEIRREYFGQGFVFKDEDAYINDMNKPCYVPELSDSIYTSKDFLRICRGKKEFADELFNQVDWQHPESLYEDMLRMNEWVICECGELIDYGDGCNDTKCRKCGKEVEI